MAGEKRPSTSTPESLFRLGRNINILGTVAVGGAALVLPGPNVILSSWAALNAVQAGGFELLRAGAKKRRDRKG